MICPECNGSGTVQIVQRWFPDVYAICTWCEGYGYISLTEKIDFRD